VEISGPSTEHLPAGRRDRVGGTPLDVRRIRRGFERAAKGYTRAAGIEHRIGTSLLEHLDGIRFAPHRIIDLGTGTGTLLRHLARRYPRAHVVGVDYTLAMLRELRPARLRFFRRPWPLCADAQQLPLADASVDMIVSSGLLQWCNSLESVLREWARVLRPGGLLTLATVGPDTLRELREIWESIDSRPHVHRFVDLHDIGDGLVRAGFAGVVMDADRLRLKYPSLEDLYHELRALGAMNAARDRPGGLAGKAYQAAARKRYEALRTEGTLPATCEIVYAHAWRAAEHEMRVDFSPGVGRAG